jgi:hypothetical protein
MVSRSTSVASQWMGGLFLQHLNKLPALLWRESLQLTGQHFAAFLRRESMQSFGGCLNKLRVVTPTSWQSGPACSRQLPIRSTIRATSGRGVQSALVGGHDPNPQDETSAAERTRSGPRSRPRPNTAHHFRRFARLPRPMPSFPFALRLGQGTVARYVADNRWPFRTSKRTNGQSKKPAICRTKLEIRILEMSDLTKREIEVDVASRSRTTARSPNTATGFVVTLDAGPSQIGSKGAVVVGKAF